MAVGSAPRTRLEKMLFVRVHGRCGRVGKSFDLSLWFMHEIVNECSKYWEFDGFREVVSGSICGGVFPSLPRLSLTYFRRALNNCSF